jgi:hypothetical protein
MYRHVEPASPDRRLALIGVDFRKTGMQGWMPIAASGWSTVPMNLHMACMTPEAGINANQRQSAVVFMVFQVSP